MDQGRYRVRFYDSSDDEESTHIAEIFPVVDSDAALVIPSPLTNSEQPQEESSFWLSRVMGSAMDYLMFAFRTQSNGRGNEPISSSPTTLSSLSDNSQWNYRIQRQLSFQDEMIPRTDSIAISEDIAVDLREVILQYRRTPYDVYMRIILAALNFGEVQISGNIFLAASGNRELIKCLLHSGKVNIDDLIVQQVIQNEINSVIEANESYRDRVDPDDIEYLALLCRVPSAILTREQARHCRQAGFEFTKMLYENPHILRNIPPPHWIISRILDCCYILNMILIWFGLIAVLLNIFCIIWFTYYWFMYNNNNNNMTLFFWTILCFIAGHIGTIIIGMLSEEEKIRDYDDRLWKYPNHSLKVIPIIPIFAIILLYLTFRYEIQKDKAKYFVIRHDLYNALSNFLIIYTFFCATTQLLLQYHLFEFFINSNNNNNEEEENIQNIFLIFTPVFYLLFGMSMYLFLWKMLFQYSCNSFGFAMMTVKQALVMPIDITTRILIVMTYFYLECNFMISLIFLLTISDCSWEGLIFIILSATITLIEIILLTFLILFKVSRFIWIICVSAIILQIVSVLSNNFINRVEGKNIACYRFPIPTPVVSVFLYITFGFMCTSFFAWAAVALHSRITGRQPFLHWDDYFYWSWGR